MFTRLKGSLLDRQCSRGKDILLRRTTDLFVKYSRLSVDEPIYNESGLKGLVLVASYTDKDENFLPGLISSCDAFENQTLP